MSDDMNEFWFVFGEGKQPPRYQHATRADALAEAERLATAHPGETFYVLEHRDTVCIKKRNVWQWRYRSAEKPTWKISRRLMDYTEAFELFIGHEFEPHAGPFEVSE